MYCKSVSACNYLQGENVYLLSIVNLMYLMYFVYLVLLSFCIFVKYANKTSFNKTKENVF